MSIISSINSSKYRRVFWALIWAVALGSGFAVYTIGIGSNPPGFFVDESGFAYNGYLVSTTGHGEFGPVGTLFFQFYTDIFTQYGAPTLVYMLALVFSIVGPSILAARLTTAATMFVACILTGVLASRISGRKLIGVVVGLCALATPWLFEVGRLVLDTWLYPLAMILFLSAVYRVYKRESWRVVDSLLIMLPLVLLTYSYTIGRLFGPLMALGLIIFVKRRQHLIAVLLTWSGYALTFIPLIMYARANPDLTSRFSRISYIKSTTRYSEAIPKFLSRYFEDLNPWTLLSIGDENARHHLPNSLGSILLGTFVFAVIGISIIAIRHRTNRFWLFIIYGFLASIIPGALTWDHAHTLRMIAYPVFLLILTVPAFQWFFEESTALKDEEDENAEKTGKIKSEQLNDNLQESGGAEPVETQPDRPAAFTRRLRFIVASILLALTFIQAGYFQFKNYNDRSRQFEFDASYKKLYDLALEQPERPIYLYDDSLGPLYIHAFWYASVEGRDPSEFNHLYFTDKPPPGSIVLSSGTDCYDCDRIAKEDRGILYRTR